MAITFGIVGAIAYVGWKNWPTIKRALDGGLPATKGTPTARTVGGGTGDATAAKQTSWKVNPDSPVSTLNQKLFGGAIQGIDWGGLGGVIV